MNYNMIAEEFLMRT